MLVMLPSSLQGLAYQALLLVLLDISTLSMQQHLQLQHQRASLPADLQQQQQLYLQVLLLRQYRSRTWDNTMQLLRHQLLLLLVGAVLVVQAAVGHGGLGKLQVLCIRHQVLL